MIFTTLLSLLVAVVTAAASPLQPQQLEVITPRITSPTESDCWAPGSIQNVTWDTSRIPPAFVNNTGMIMLARPETTYDKNGNPRMTENLNYTNPLATRFPIGTGHQTVQIPIDTPPNNGYVIVLFGDSGNCSPKFKIRK
ncbi:hypothetical protein MVEN_00374200 [Mycena venus]|uniref:Uncharacterized protein n=1 Tax=Mycena venus TaxID=2733690 RepID=A0A8H6YVF7_9AGAR|nr:hypothetical protein MVEN_00374200 [Mycena venus]